jgi:FkbM family methyltransferase
MSKTSIIINNFRNKVYKGAKTNKSLKLLTHFTKIGNIPLQGRVFPLTFNEKNIFFYVPKNHLELAEAILHFEKSDTDCKEIIKYFEKNHKVVASRRFLDVGANQGLYSVALRKENFDTLSVEGNHELVNVIKINYLLNGYTTAAAVLEMWVTPNIESNYFKHEADFSLTNAVKKFGQTEILNKITLGELLSEFNPSVVKLDLEGLDSEVILSIKSKDFKNVDYLVIEQESDDLNSNKVTDHMKSIGMFNSLSTNLQGVLVDSKMTGLINRHYTRV